MSNYMDFFFKNLFLYYYESFSMTNKNVTCIRHDNNDVQRIPRHDDVIVEISTRLKSPIPSEKLKSREKNNH